MLGPTCTTQFPFGEESKMMTSHTLNARRKQSGITLIEVSIGLIIAAIVAAAAFIAFQNNARRTEVQDNIKQLTEIITETKQKVGISTGYTGLDTDAGLRLALLPANSDGTLAKNSYNGAGAIALTGTADDAATLSWPDVPADQCGDIALNVAPQATSVTGLGEAVPVVNGAISAADLVDICNDEEDTTLVFAFGRR
jgi:prepilin-type N-terminal cleavage/methylation domain-containing protein